MKLSVIVPCFNEEKALNLFYLELIKELKFLNENYELIFVDDGSKDKTLDILKNLKSNNQKIRIIEFSRNFGKEAAMYAGLNASKGDLVVVMDADLQDPPNLIKEMIEILDNDEYDSVATYRVDRKGEPFIRSIFARTFYKLINKMIEVDIVDGARDYRMMKRTMVNAVISLNEVNRFSKGIFSWVGFKTKYLEFENKKRIAGETKWSFFKLFNYAIEGIVAFTIVPLKIATIFGILFSIIGFSFMFYITFKTLIFGEVVSGYPSLVVLISILGGIQLIVLGIIGEYLARTYLETKKRPVYIIRNEY